MFSKRPILIGGLGLSATLWLMDVVHFNILDGSTLAGAIALGSGMWWWQRHKPRPTQTVQPPAQTDREAVRAAIDRVSQLIDRLEETAAPLSPSEQPSSRLEAFRQRRQTLIEALDRQGLRLAVAGAAGTGKTTLVQQLADHLCLPNYTVQELGPNQDGREHDAVLLLTDGDLTESARQRLMACVQLGQAVTLVFNKQDHYLPADRQVVLQQLQRRTAELPVPVPVVAIAAAPKPTCVRRYGSNGEVEEFLEPTPPELESLTESLQLLAERTHELVPATTLRQVELWRREVQQALNHIHRQQAMPIVEQLQWAAAASAFAIPTASLDLLAAAAINTQLLMDLGKIYGLSWSWEEAKALATNLAQLTVKLGLIEVSTQALSLALKGHVATYAVGGLVQGLSAAYLTHMVGLSLIETLEAAALEDQASPQISIDALGQRLKAMLLQNRQPFIQDLVKQGLKRLRPADNDSPTLAPTA